MQSKVAVCLFALLLVSGASASRQLKIFSFFSPVPATRVTVIRRARPVTTTPVIVTTETVETSEDDLVVDTAMSPEVATAVAADEDVEEAVPPAGAVAVVEEAEVEVAEAPVVIVAKADVTEEAEAPVVVEAPVVAEAPVVVEAPVVAEAPVVVEAEEEATELADEDVASAPEDA